MKAGIEKNNLAMLIIVEIQGLAYWEQLNREYDTRTLLFVSIPTVVFMPPENQWTLCCEKLHSINCIKSNYVLCNAVLAIYALLTTVVCFSFI